MMMTAEKEVADALAELREISRDYKAGSQAWLGERREIIDIIVAHADVRTLQAILDHLEKSCDWTRWPLKASDDPLTARQPSARTLPGDGVTEMPDNIPPGSGSDAMDRLRVAIENHQKATERQTGTTRWLTWVMTALTILMTVPTVVQIWRAYSEIWPVVRLWRPW